MRLHAALVAFMVALAPSAKAADCIVAPAAGHASLKALPDTFWRSHAAWIVSQMIRWGQAPADVDLAAAIDCYRPDLFRKAAADAGLIGVAGVGCLEVCDDALAGRESRQLIRDGLDPGQGRHIGLTGEEACFGEHPQAGGEVAGDHRAAPPAGRRGGA